MSSTSQREPISTAKAQRWRRRIAETLTLARSGDAQAFSLNLMMTMSVFAAGVIVEKLIVVPYLARRLDEATLGAILLGRNATVVLSSGISSGLLSLLLRHNQDWECAKKIVAVRSAVVLSLILSAVVVLFTIAALLAWNGADYVVRQAIPISAFVIWGVTNTVAFLLQTYWRMQMRIPLLSLMQLSIGTGLLIILPLHYWLGLPGVFWGFIAAGVAPLGATIFMLRRDLPQEAVPFWSAGEAWRLGKGMWVFVWGNVCQSLLQNVDRFVIGYLVGTAAVAAYFKVTSTAYMILVPVEPVAALILSMIAQERMGENTKRLLRLLHLLILVMMVGALAGGTLCGKTLTDLLYGVGTFESGKALYFIVLIGCSFSIAPILLRGMMIVHVASSQIVWIDSLSLLFAVLSNSVLIARYGLIGAAMAAALTMLFRASLSEAVIILTFWRRVQQGSQKS